MDHTTQWAQGIGFLKKPMEEEDLLHSSNIRSEIRAPILSQQQVVERKQRPHKEQALLHCPRCNSTNTKFCYYNNYSLTQPRYFCKTCRRYWTEGGSLRNVPVGGGSRKNKRSHSSNSNSSSSKILPPPPPPPPQISITSTSCHQPFDQVRDLNLTFPNPNPNPNPNHGYDMNNNINNSGGLSAMELLRSTGITARGVGPPLVPMGNGLYNFDGIMQEGNSRRVLFPFGEHRGQVGENPIFWNGMMGGGSGSW